MDLELSSNVMTASGQGFHEADVSSTSIPLRASPVDGEFINSGRPINENRTL